MHFARFLLSFFFSINFTSYFVWIVFYIIFNSVFRSIIIFDKFSVWFQIEYNWLKKIIYLLFSNVFFLLLFFSRIVCLVSNLDNDNRLIDTSSSIYSESGKLCVEIRFKQEVGKNWIASFIVASIGFVSAHCSCSILLFYVSVPFRPIIDFIAFLVRPLLFSVFLVMSSFSTISEVFINEFRASGKDFLVNKMQDEKRRNVVRKMNIRAKNYLK